MSRLLPFATPVTHARAQRPPPALSTPILRRLITDAYLLAGEDESALAHIATLLHRAAHPTRRRRRHR